MKFIQEYVPDKRWADGQRPIEVIGNPVLWILWKIAKFLEEFFYYLKLFIERSFVIVEEHKEDENV